jgi:hypothetical protein
MKELTPVEIGYNVLAEISRLKEIDREEKWMDPEGAYFFRSPEQRKRDHDRLSLLKHLSGIK